MIFRVNRDELKLTSNSTVFENQNRIRKFWVSAVRGTPFEIRLLSLDKSERMQVYNKIDKAIRDAYVNDMKSYKVDMKEQGNYSSKSVLGSRIVHNSAQRNLDDVLINVVERTLYELAPVIFSE